MLGTERHFHLDPGQLPGGFNHLLVLNTPSLCLCSSSVQLTESVPDGK